MENEFNEPKDTFLSQIIVTKNLDDVKTFAKETRKKLYDIIKEYRKTDGRLDEELFHLEQKMIGNILVKSYKFVPDQNFRELQKFYNDVIRYSISFNKMDEAVKDIKELR